MARIWKLQARTTLVMWSSNESLLSIVIPSTQSNSQSPVLQLFDLDLHFKVKVLAFFLASRIFRKQRKLEKNITTVIRWEVIYLPSNGDTGNVVHHDLDLHFQGHEFLIVNISINGSRKRLKIVAKF